MEWRIKNRVIIVFRLSVRDCVFASALVQQGNYQGNIKKVEEAWEASGNSGATIGNLLFIYLFVTCGILIIYPRDIYISRFLEHI